MDQLVVRLEGRRVRVTEYSASDASRALADFLETLQQTYLHDLVNCRPDAFVAVQAQVLLLQELEGVVRGTVKTNCRV